MAEPQATPVFHFRELPELRTERLLLRTFRANDLEAVFEYASDPQVTRFTIFDYHRSLDDTHAFLDPLLEKQARGELVPHWAIQEAAGDGVIGSIAFAEVSLLHLRGEIGYVLGRKYWGRGYMTEAVRWVVRFAFEQMRLNRVEARCDVNNTASWRVMEKAGMSYEGTLRENIILHGTPRDARIYAVVRSDHSWR